ncbi:tetratricopeptide repeat protein [Nibricoccus aquaticus]|nr:tetratricopeptide repeat protein [Nibricoccus aquaticus]
MRAFVLCLFVLALLLSRLPGAPIGRILPNVVCAADPAQSYALYVPSAYVAERKWPVIFCFDPSARGLIPVERLKGAAEKYGYILVGSLTSKNGPYAANAQAAGAMMRDVGAHLSLDPQRLYTAGMSGGARVATSIAMSGVAKGVIACGAGFPKLEEGIPRRVPFVFYGIVGVEDFNLAEFRRLAGELEEREAVHHISVFEGGHVWAPEQELTGAVEWLELQAMRGGKKPVDVVFVRAMLEARADALGKLTGVEQWRGLRALAADFDGVAEVGDFKKRAAALGSSKDVKSALKAEKDFFFREQRLAEEIGELVPLSTARKQRFAAKLRQRMDVAGNAGERQMIRRAIAGYCSMARVTYRDWMDQREYRQAAAAMEMFVALQPDHARGWFDLARAYAAGGDEKGAVEALERSAQAGFDDPARVEKELVFSRLSENERFQAALSRITSNKSEPTTQLPAMRVSAVLASVELRLFYQARTDGDSSLVAFLKVVSVRRGSAAARAGVTAGMEVMGIQQIRVSGLTEGELNNALAQSVRGEILLTVRDDAGDSERTLRIPITKSDGSPTSGTADAHE